MDSKDKAQLLGAFIRDAEHLIDDPMVFLAITDKGLITVSNSEKLLTPESIKDMLEAACAMEGREQLDVEPH